MSSVYLINKYDNWCPENNNGDYFVAAFSTLELAKDYKAKAIAIEGEDGTWGYGIRWFDLDVEVPIDYKKLDEEDAEKFDLEEAMKALAGLKDEL
jgi:hypothetical protein